MKAAAVTLAITLVAAVGGQLIATYLVNNVRAVRNVTGPL